MNAIVPPNRDQVQEASARMLQLKVAESMIRRSDEDLREFVNERLAPGERVPAVVDGVTLGYVSKPKTSYKPRISDRDELFTWVKAHRPDQIRRSVNLTPAIVDALAAMWPDAVVEEIHPAYERALLKEAKEAGRAPDAGGGEAVPGIEVEPTTEYVSTSKLPEDAYEIVWKAWQSGDLGQIVVSPLPELPAAPETPAGLGHMERQAWRLAQDNAQADEPAEPELAKPGGPFDQSTPEGAAAHATVIQGGYSTPEIEARRLVRDRDPEVRERAEIWLYDNGCLSEAELAWLVDNRPGATPLPDDLAGVSGE